MREKGIGEASFRGKRRIWVDIRLIGGFGGKRYVLQAGFSSLLPC
jgi:hypothetical protein